MLGVALQTQSLQLGMGELLLECRALRLLLVGSTLLFGLSEELSAYYINRGCQSG